MNSMLRILVYATLNLVLETIAVHATDYVVCFGAKSTGTEDPVCVVSDEIKPWASKGRHDSLGRLTGLNLQNATGKTITSVHVLTTKRGDRFIVPTPTDNFFLKIWVKKDGKEVIFNGGLIRDGDEFLSKAMKTDGPIFNGRVSFEDIKVENANDWNLVHDGTRDLGNARLQFMTYCPSIYRSVDLYSESKDGDVCFTSKGRIYVFSASSKTVSPVQLTQDLPGKITRIDSSDELNRFVLFSDGKEVGVLKYTPNEHTGKVPLKFSK